jgi:hypothetical protein
VHTYDAHRRLPYSSPLPAVRPARDTSGSSSATPIYDALYAEYLRTFRALPGDRSGEEEFGLAVFGDPYGPGARTPTVYGMRPVSRQHATGLTPAALPPGPRRER